MVFMYSYSWGSAPVSFNLRELAYFELRHREPCEVIKLRHCEVPQLRALHEEERCRGFVQLFDTMGARRWLGLGRIVETEPECQAELRFLQFPGTVFNTLQIM